jgi:hypothetical protein
MHKVHFWVDGIHRDIRQMHPLMLPDDVRSELLRIHETATGRQLPTIKGNADCLLQIVEGALGGSVVAHWAAAMDVNTDPKYSLISSIHGSPI